MWSIIHPKFLGAPPKLLEAPPKSWEHPPPNPGSIPPILVALKGPGNLPLTAQTPYSGGVPGALGWKALPSTALSCTSFCPAFSGRSLPSPTASRGDPSPPPRPHSQAMFLIKRSKCLWLEVTFSLCTFLFIPGRNASSIYLGISNGEQEHQLAHPLTNIHYLSEEVSTNPTAVQPSACGQVTWHVHLKCSCLERTPTVLLPLKTGFCSVPICGLQESWTRTRWRFSIGYSSSLCGDSQVNSDARWASRSEGADCGLAPAPEHLLGTLLLHSCLFYLFPLRRLFQGGPFLATFVNIRWLIGNINKQFFVQSEG